MNVTQHRLAKAIGLDARRIHSIVHGERSITAGTDHRLSNPGFLYRPRPGFHCQLEPWDMKEPMDEIVLAVSSQNRWRISLTGEGTK